VPFRQRVGRLHVTDGAAERRGAARDVGGVGADADGVGGVAPDGPGRGAGLVVGAAVAHHAVGLPAGDAGRQPHVVASRAGEAGDPTAQVGEVALLAGSQASVGGVAVKPRIGPVGPGRRVRHQRHRPARVARHLVAHLAVGARRGSAHCGVGGDERGHRVTRRAGERPRGRPGNGGGRRAQREWHPPRRSWAPWPDGSARAAAAPGYV
jgi:hypothetical protein